MRNNGYGQNGSSQRGGYRSDYSGRGYSGRDGSGRDYSGRGYSGSGGSGRDYSGRGYDQRDSSGRGYSGSDYSRQNASRGDYPVYAPPKQEYYTDPSTQTVYYDQDYDPGQVSNYTVYKWKSYLSDGGAGSRNREWQSSRPATVLLTAVIAAAVIMSGMLLNSYSAPGIRTGTSLGLMDSFRQRADKITYEALGEVLGKTQSFYIPDTTVVCPKPDSDCYGSSSDDAVIRSVISSSDLTKGMNMVWHEGLTYHNDIEPVYYSDPSIIALTWKVCDGISVINFSEVIVADGSQFRRFLCDNTFGSNHEKYATTMAENVNAVLATNGDFYIHRQAGVVVYQGKVYRNNPQFLDHCFIDDTGDMIFKRQGEIGDNESFQKFVDDNNIRFSLSFGPILVEDHKAIERIGSYNLGEVHDTSARASIGLIEPRHYLFCLIEGGKKGYVGADIMKIAGVMEQQGCEKAYTIDGGQTAVLIFNNKIYNRIVYDAERQVSDILYFATAVGE